MTREAIIAKFSQELPVIVASVSAAKRNGWRYRLRGALVKAGADYNEATYLGWDLLRAADAARSQ